MASRTRLPPPKKKKNRITQPSSADEYLAVGVEHEEAAEKWRAGDAVKSMRFYDRALENYETAMARWPENFDVAYNKARILFAVTQHPGQRALLERPLEQQLSLALDVHRLALKLAPDNADVLFNTAQVLSALADELDDDAQDKATAALEESVTLLNHCLDLQTKGLQRQQADIDAARQEQVGQVVAADERAATPSSSSGSENGDWATIEQPIDAATLLETGTTIFDTLTSLSELLPSGSPDGLHSLEQMAGQVRSKLDALQLQVGAEDMADLLLAEARLNSALLAAAFEAGTVDINSYDTALKQAFERIAASGGPSVAVAYAQALLDLATATEGAPNASQLRWNRTSKALGLLASAAQSPKVDSLVALHALRGDLEMFRHRLSFDAQLPDNLRTEASRETLLTNAGKYYRGAVASARDADSDAAQSAVIKGAFAAALAQHHLRPLEELATRGIQAPDIHTSLREAVEGHLLAEQQIHSLGLDKLIPATQAEGVVPSAIWIRGGCGSVSRP